MKKHELKTLSIVALFQVFCVFVFIEFLSFHELRVEYDGIFFEDPAFIYLPISDVSFPIFLITYGAVVTYLLLNRKKEHFLSRLLLSYAFIVLFRIITMSSLPLREPDTLVYLEDPFLNNLIYPGDIVRDLFFSGHTALLFAIFLQSGKKWYFLVLTIILAILLLIQRVHFSIDVIAAIPFAWLAVFFANTAIAKWSYKEKK